MNESDDECRAFVYQEMIFVADLCISDPRDVKVDVD